MPSANYSYNNIIINILIFLNKLYTYIAIIGCFQILRRIGIVQLVCAKYAFFKVINGLHQINSTKLTYVAVEK